MIDYSQQSIEIHIHEPLSFQKTGGHSRWQLHPGTVPGTGECLLTPITDSITKRKCLRITDLLSVLGVDDSHGQNSSMSLFWWQGAARVISANLTQWAEKLCSYKQAHCCPNPKPTTRLNTKHEEPVFTEPWTDIETVKECDGVQVNLWLNSWSDWWLLENHVLH